MRIYKRKGSPSWWVTWNDQDGRRHRRSSGTDDKKLAEALAFHTASQVLKYDTAEEAASAIEATIIPLAEAHAFDEALEATLMEHKERSEHRKMVAEANREPQEITGYRYTSLVALALTPDFKRRRTSSRAMSAMGH